MKMYIGLDVHSKKTTCVAQDETGKGLGRMVVDTTEAGLNHMLERYGAPPKTRIGLETGCQARWVFQILERAGMDPVVIEAGEVRAKQSRRGQKDDFRDAKHICEGLVCNQWKHIVWIPGHEIDQLRYLLLRRNHYVRLCTREIASAKGLLRSRGISTSKMCLTTEAGWKKLLQRTDVTALAEDLQMLFVVWKLASKSVAKIEKRLAKARKPFVEPMKLVATFFGVGDIGSSAFVAWVGDPQRFPTSNHLISYLGLAPSTYDSGEKQRRGHITKQGPRLLRSILIELAHQARRLKHPLNPYYRRLVTKRGKKCALVAIAARIARILWQMWRKNEPFDVGKLNVTAGLVTRLKRYHYELREQVMAKHMAATRS
jgi:transposase